MSRIGNKPITIPSGVSIQQENGVLTVQGPKGTLSQSIDPCIAIKQEESTLYVSRSSEAKRDKSFHGLYRTLTQNMIIGVSEGYVITLELVGVGYKASNQGQWLELILGYSHSIVLEIPQEVSVATETPKAKGGSAIPRIILQSHDKQLIGQIAGKIRSLRKVEPYKGKGVRFLGENVRRKPGKAAKKS